MKVDPLVTIESDLLAFTARVVFYGCLRFAMPLGIAATVRLSEHEVLLARYAAAPKQRGNEQQ